MFENLLSLAVIACWLTLNFAAGVILWRALVVIADHRAKMNPPQPAPFGGGSGMVWQCSPAPLLAFVGSAVLGYMAHFAAVELGFDKWQTFHFQVWAMWFAMVIDVALYLALRASLRSGTDLPEWGC